MKRLYPLLVILFMVQWACEDKQENDCAGEENGTATVDDCGLCTGGTTELLPNYLMDCAGECGGDAELDNCDQCVGGNSGEVACTQGCNGDWGGTVLIDCLGICGGNTPDADNDGICDWCIPSEHMGQKELI